MQDASPSPSSQGVPATPLIPTQGSARDEFVRAHEPLVDTVVRSILRGRRPYGAEVEDVMQEARIGLIGAMDSFQPGRGAKFRTWAWTKIDGAVRNYLASLKPAPDLDELGELRIDPERLATPDTTPRSDDFLAIQELLPRLDERDRDLLQWRFSDNLTNAAIAARLDISERHAGRLIEAALGRLRTFLEVSP